MTRKLSRPGQTGATGTNSGRTSTPSSVRPAFVSPGRDQTDPGSFWPTLHLALIYAFGTLATIALGVVIAVLLTSGGATFIPDNFN